MLALDSLATPLIGPISLQIPFGTCCVLQGASGAGKSLLLRAVADLDPATGSVRLDGLLREELAAPDWRRRVALVPATSGWWAPNVAEHFGGAAGDSPDELLSAVGLPEAMGWEVARLSTGERQRLALARALALRPQVLLLDEPTGALDAAATDLVERLIRACLADGMAVLLVTHDDGQAARLGDMRRQMVGGTLQEPAP